LETRVHNLQRGTIHQQSWQLWKAYNNPEEMVMAMARTGEHIPTMGRQVATVAFAELIAGVIAIAIWEETVAVGYQPEIVRRVYWQGLS